jgi:hypothetical protein
MPEINARRMKTFRADIIPQLQGLGLSVEEPSSFVNRHWVAIDEHPGCKRIFIFQSPGNHLVFGEHCQIEQGTWEHIFPDELLICRSDENELFSISFVDDTVMALRSRGLETYALLVEAEHFDAYLNSADDVCLYLKKQYGHLIHSYAHVSRHTTIDLPTAAHPDCFIPEEYPTLLSDLKTIREELKHVPKEDAAEILLSYCRYHSMPAKDVRHNPILTELILDGKVPCGVLEKLFSLKKDNPAFLKDLEDFVTRELNLPFEQAPDLPAYSFTVTGKDILPGDVHTLKMEVAFSDGQKASIWKSDHHDRYYYFDTQLEGYLAFESEEECMASVHELVK